MRRLLFLSFSIILGFFALPLFVFSEPAPAGEQGGTNQEITRLNEKIAEKRERVRELEESIARVKKDINKAQLQKVSFQNQLAILTNRETQSELDIRATEEKIDTLELEIQAFTLDIAQKETDIERQKKMIAEFVRTLYYENGKEYIEILAAYDTFSDFYNRLQYLQTIESDLSQSARGLRLAKADIENKKIQTEERQRSYEALKKELEEKQRDLEEQIFAKESLLEQTRSSERTFETLLAGLRKQYQEVETEIANIEKEVRLRLEEEDKLARADEPTYDGKLSWPTASRYITAYFRDPDYPYRHIFEHNAVDIRAGQGTPVKAAASGYVGRARHCTSSKCYSYIMLIHSGGLATVYGHLSGISVGDDQFVTRGDVIGYSGGTPGTVGAGPFVTGPHLHFEVRKNGIPVNPLDYLVRDWDE